MTAVDLLISAKSDFYILPLNPNTT